MVLPTLGRICLDGFSATGATPSITNVSTAKAGIYSVSVTGANSCSNSATTSVIINSQGASASSNSPVCQGFYCFVCFCRWDFLLVGGK
ncbi:MAG: hypothetical protein U0Y10_26720 [Spirosomataceae bacterium]